MPQNPPESSAKGWRLKKSEDGAVFGPVEESVLQAWAVSAQISPEDHIDREDDHWVSAPTVAFLEMVWQVTLENGQTYGPTTWGTLTEFLKEGLVSPKTQATHVITNETKALNDLVFAQLQEAFPPPIEPALPATATVPMEKLTPSHPSRSGMIIVDIAKDQRIRQLEEDLRNLKKEHEELLQKYRVLNKEAVELRTKAGKSSSF